MSKLWAGVAGTGNVLEQDLQAVALQLTCGQVLYADNVRHRAAYQLVRTYRGQFAEVLEHLGLRLGIDDEYRMVYVTCLIDIDRPITRKETLLALTLRKIHHFKSSQGESKNGVVTLSVPDLFAAYQAVTGRELPKGRGEFEVLRDAMGRYGFLRRVSNDPDSDLPYDLEILPGITALISEDVLRRFTEDAGEPSDSGDMGMEIGEFSEDVIA